MEEETGKKLPAFVVNAWRSYLDCGLGGAEFRRLVCEKCLDETIVCFSCKTRQLCPSCAARHMANGPAKLVDTVIPRVPMWQNVLSLLFGTWGRAGLRPKPMNSVQREFVAACRRGARHARGSTDSSAGERAACW
ncbi:MAG: transposase zinc-binding domain-containing protein [Deltaproteobacteria bacterium]|nr:transposase zinc-binding domain-containing protein [Deltaproteobacteria bacterium]